MNTAQETFEDYRLRLAITTTDTGLESAKTGDPELYEMARSVAVMLARSGEPFPQDVISPLPRRRFRSGHRLRVPVAVCRRRYREHRFRNLYRYQPPRWLSSALGGGAS